MNLITDPWVPVVRASGTTSAVRVAELADASDPPIHLHVARPDWSLAGQELLIGLLRMACPPHDADDWRARAGRHHADDLAAALAPFAPWFELLAGDGPRFLQTGSSVATERLSMSRLTIDAPMANTLVNCADILSHLDRAPDAGMAPGLAAIALYTYQAFAPMGGQGHRASVRGGGPLSSFVVPASGTLLDALWANVAVGAPLDPGDSAAREHVLPWTAPMPRAAKAGPVAPAGDDPSDLHVYFPMSRLFHLETGPGGHCAFGGGECERLVTAVRTAPNGIAYESSAWRHPQTPYYLDGEVRRPLHPKPGPVGLRRLVGSVHAPSETDPVPEGDPLPQLVCAPVVATYRRERAGPEDAATVLLGGWAVDQTKALEWVDARTPLAGGELAGQARAFGAADLAGRALAGALIGALGEDAGDGLAQARERFERGIVDAAEHLARAVDAEAAPADGVEHWRRSLVRESLGAFDALTRIRLLGAYPDEVQRIAAARRKLLATFAGRGPLGKNIAALLELPPA